MDDLEVMLKSIFVCVCACVCAYVWAQTQLCLQASNSTLGPKQLSVHGKVEVAAEKTDVPRVCKCVQIHANTCGVCVCVCE